MGRASRRRKEQEEAGVNATDVVKAHVVAVLKSAQKFAAELEKKAKEYEAAGYRIVDHVGGQPMDYRTGDQLMEVNPDWDYKTGEAYRKRLYGNEAWVDLSTLHHELWDSASGDEEVVTAGIPEDLCRAITEWVEGHDDDAEIAEFIGWTTAEVDAARTGGLMKPL